jgi:hypothetical protein
MWFTHYTHTAPHLVPAGPSYQCPACTALAHNMTEEGQCTVHHTESAHTFPAAMHGQKSEACVNCSCTSALPPLPCAAVHSMHGTHAHHVGEVKCHMPNHSPGTWPWSSLCTMALHSLGAQHMLTSGWPAHAAWLMADVHVGQQNVS